MKTEGKITLTAKLLEDKLKLGWGTNDFSEHLHMPVEKFKQIFEKTFKGAAGKNYTRRLKTNDKKIEQQLRRRAISKKTGRFEEKAKEISTSNDAETEQENAIETADFSEVGNNEDDMDVLEKLQKEEEFYRNYLISLENDHKAAETERNQLFEILTKFRDKMLELRKELEECQLKSQDYTAQKDQISARIDEINQEKAITNMRITEIQEQIKKLQKIEVFVYKKCIEIDPEDYEIPDGWISRRNSWIDDERFESLTMLELSTLAKAVCLAESISADGRKSSFVFESDQMQNLFSELSK